jgi:hypothetical protein
MKERVNKERSEDFGSFVADWAAFDRGEQNKRFLSLNLK